MRIFICVAVAPLLVANIVMWWHIHWLASLFFAVLLICSPKLIGDSWYA